MVESDYGRLEWSQSQMAFHFAQVGDGKKDGWEVVVEKVHFNVSGGFISFLNCNWKQRQGIPACEIRKMFDAWLSMGGGCHG